MEEELFGKLFNTVPLVDENHLDTILNTMDSSHATYLLVQAVKHAYHSGVYSLGESEVISKCIRTLGKNKKEKVSE
jgi:hypothetical protein